MDAILVIVLLTPLVQCQTPQYYEPVWSGRGCRPGETVDVGRGSGSCNTDCDCPLCAPFCSRSGYCQNHQNSGRRKCLASDKSSAACPPLIGDPSPPGCNLTFVRDVDGEFPCETSDDCPMGFDWWEDQPEGIQCGIGNQTFASCVEKKCRFQSSNCGAFTWCFDEDENMIIHGNYECYDIEDCQINWYYGLDNYQTLNSKLDMKCENNRCISQNLWSNIPYVEDESGDMYKKLDNILGVQKIYSCSSECIAGGCGGTVSFSRDTPSISIVSESNSISSCDNCSKTECPPDKPCRNRKGNCKRAKCNKKKCWCPKPRRKARNFVVDLIRDTPSISIVSGGYNISSCDNCSKTECPPDKPCKDRWGRCRKPNCNIKKGKCWCPKWRN